MYNDFEWILFLFFFRQDLPVFAKASPRQAGFTGFFLSGSLSG
jgi:hypothetical protein